MTHIRHIRGYEILDSRGNPTVMAEVALQSGCQGRAAVPSGASTGSREALELRDQDPKRYLGKGVLKAVHNINTEVNRALDGFDAANQEHLDQCLIELDGTPNRGYLGANAILAVSLAAAKAVAADRDIPLYRYLGHGDTFHLPVPMMNILNGGAHADNNLDIQEFMILPIGAPTFAEALRYGTEVFQHLKKLLHERKLNTNVGDEGGFAPNLPNHQAALDLIVEAIKRAGYQPGRDIYLGLDVAANELYRDKQYHLTAENRTLSANDFIDYFAELVDRYPIVSIEDGMAEDDWDGWRQLTERLGQRIQLVGDDVFVTNPAILEKGIAEHIANALLVKPNQIGTLTETLTAMRIAKAAKYNTILSHRSGETEDTTIADLAVGTDAGQIKTGSLCRSDRVAKYNRLLQIAYELGNHGVYAGQSVFKQFNCFASVTG
ncbi:MAG: phosphopyruvate hydratase [Gammaproteobacteria bacterium]|nr:phosphopyruvate hydratase [Gammaproteobacteria bacterium]